MSDGSPAGFGTAKAEWAAAAHTVLEEVARTTGATITYAELGEAVQTATGIRTRSLLHNWIGDVLGLVGRECFTRGEPLLSSLCVRSGGDVGPGYGTLLAQTSGEQPANLDQHAAAERRRCYDWFRSGS